MPLQPIGHLPLTLAVLEGHEEHRHARAEPQHRRSVAKALLALARVGVGHGSRGQLRGPERSYLSLKYSPTIRSSNPFLGRLARRTRPNTPSHHHISPTLTCFVLGHGPGCNFPRHRKILFQHHAHMLIERSWLWRSARRQPRNRKRPKPPPLNYP